MENSKSKVSNENCRSKTFMQDCIIDSLLLLLQNNTIDEITIKEITRKAGVNRSTYYRHFSDKASVIRGFYSQRLDEAFAALPDDISARDYLAGIFNSFIQYKKELLLLHKHALSYHLLDEMNSRISQAHGNASDALFSLYCNYHIGGVFNCFCYWLSEEMQTSPLELANRCIEFLPADFSPRLKH